MIGRTFFGFGITLTLVSVAGCDSDPKSGNGVNDVRASCEIRAKWVRTANKCTECEAAVVSTRCDCIELADFSGACLDQANARAPVCPETIDTCVAGCARTDCTCIDACYANDAACKAASAARDGCIAEACEPQCK